MALHYILQDNRWNDSYITCILHYHTCKSLFIRKYLIFVPSFNFCRVFLPWSSTDRQLWSWSIINLLKMKKRGIMIINSHIEGDDICFYCCYLYEVVWVAKFNLSMNSYLPFQAFSTYFIILSITMSDSDFVLGITWFWAIYAQMLCGGVRKLTSPTGNTGGTLCVVRTITPWHLSIIKWPIYKCSYQNIGLID